MSDSHLPGLHRLKVFLIRNPFKTKPTDGNYMGQLDLNRSVGLKELAQSCAERGGSQHKEDVLESAVIDMMREAAFLSCDGFTVNLGGYINIIPRFKGVFQDITDRFDPAKHRVYFDAQEGDLLRRERESIHVTVAGLAPDHTIILEVINVFTGGKNGDLTKGRNLRILGTNLRIEGDEAHKDIIGVYLDDSKALVPPLKVPEADIVVNNPSEVMIVIPNIAAGSTWRLRLVTQTMGRGSKSSPYRKEPATVIFDPILTAVQ
ncbi:hypothetical protein Barb6XT_00174 [Bacteroidales bacterium Barb6XT]|nr:hypothetical protein Barb6XT_00174 [Bacteroidales bacterium Barb6XT]